MELTFTIWVYVSISLFIYTDLLVYFRVGKKQRAVKIISIIRLCMSIAALILFSLNEYI